MSETPRLDAMPEVSIPVPEWRAHRNYDLGSRIELNYSQPPLGGAVPIIDSLHSSFGLVEADQGKEHSAAEAVASSIRSALTAAGDEPDRLVRMSRAVDSAHNTMSELRQNRRQIPDISWGLIEAFIDENGNKKAVVAATGDMHIIKSTNNNGSTLFNRLTPENIKLQADTNGHNGGTDQKIIIDIIDLQESETVFIASQVEATRLIGRQAASAQSATVEDGLKNPPRAGGMMAIGLSEKEHQENVKSGIKNSFDGQGEKSAPVLSTVSVDKNIASSERHAHRITPAEKASIVAAAVALAMTKSGKGRSAIGALAKRKRKNKSALGADSAVTTTSHDVDTPGYESAATEKTRPVGPLAAAAIGAAAVKEAEEAAPTTNVIPPAGGAEGSHAPPDTAAPGVERTRRRKRRTLPFIGALAALGAATGIAYALTGGDTTHESSGAPALPSASSGPARASAGVSSARTTGSVSSSAAAKPSNNSPASSGTVNGGGATHGAASTKGHENGSSGIQGAQSGAANRTVLSPLRHITAGDSYEREIHIDEAHGRLHVPAADFYGSDAHEVQVQLVKDYGPDYMQYLDAQGRVLAHGAGGDVYAINSANADYGLRFMGPARVTPAAQAEMDRLIITIVQRRDPAYRVPPGIPVSGFTG